jgi:hypothetical protein
LTVKPFQLNRNKAASWLLMLGEFIGVERRVTSELTKEHRQTWQLASIALLLQLRILLYPTSHSPLLNGALEMAMGQMDRYRKQLTALITGGLHPFDNDIAEKTIRPLSIGRFSNTPQCAMAYGFGSYIHLHRVFLNYNRHGTSMNSKRCSDEIS